MASECAHIPVPTLGELFNIYELIPQAMDPDPVAIAIFDDVLTAWTHFRAMKTVLSRAFPDAPISGVFITRRVFPEITDEFDC